MIRTFIQWTSMILTLEASYFLVKVNLGLSPKAIAEISIPHLDYNNEESIKILTKQSVDTKIGLVLLILSFALQIVNALWPLSWNDFGIDRCGAAFSIVFCIIVFIIAYYYSRIKSKRIFNQSMQIIKNRSKK
ncbi:MAG: hypothetical protein WBL85_06825 [Sedimentisphaerales bacterium]